MAVSKILFVVLLGLYGSALADDTTSAATTTAGTGSTPYGAVSTAGGVQDCLTEADKAKICELKPDTSNSTTPASGNPAATTPASSNPAATTPSGQPGICPTAGPADDFCSKVAASVNGTSPCCLVSNVCSFKIASGSNSTTTAGTGPTTPATTTTTAGTVTTAGTGSTIAGTGSTTAGPVITPEPNTVYVSCHTVPSGFQQIKTCSNGNVIFVYPAASSGSTGPTTPKSTGSTAVDPTATTIKY